jgi:hypothetical protein
VTTTTSYRDAAVALWGDAGAYTHGTYTRLREQHYPELPAQLPIVIGITAYGHVAGLCASTWEHGPRITIESRRFAQGRHWIDDLLTHEMLHAWLHVTGQETGHKSEPWYEAVRQLSPAVLGHPLDARRGADRKSVRVPNPDWREDSSEPKTLVRKITVPDVVQHRDVAGWPQAFRPDAYDWGTPIACPTY